MQEREIFENRYLLVKIFSFNSGLSPSAGAKQLLALAVEHGDVDDNKTLSGNRLKMWGLHGNAPDWVCRAAYRYLISIHYQPSSNVEQAVFCYYQRLL